MCVVQVTPCIDHELHIEIAARRSIPLLHFTATLLREGFHFDFGVGSWVLRERGIQKPFAASRETTFDFRYVEVSLSARLILGLR